LNPSDLVIIVPEVVPGFPDRFQPRNTKAATELKRRTLTNLYNQRPAWLENAHQDLDAAVARAYGWPADISNEEVLEALLKINAERAKRDEESENQQSQAKQARINRQSPSLALPILGGKAGEESAMSKTVPAVEQIVPKSGRRTG